MKRFCHACRELMSHVLQLAPAHFSTPHNVAVFFCSVSSCPKWILSAERASLVEMWFIRDECRKGCKMLFARKLVFDASNTAEIARPLDWSNRCWELRTVRTIRTSITCQCLQPPTNDSLFVYTFETCLNPFRQETSTYIRRAFDLFAPSKRQRRTQMGHDQRRVRILAELRTRDIDVHSLRSNTWGRTTWRKADKISRKNIDIIFRDVHCPKRFSAVGRNVLNKWG